MRSDEKLRRHTAAVPSLAGLTCPQFDRLAGRLPCAEADLRAGRHSQPDPAGRLPMAPLWLRDCSTGEVLSYFFTFFNRHKRNGLAALGFPDPADDLPCGCRTTPDRKKSRSAAEVLAAFPQVRVGLDFEGQRLERSRGRAREPDGRQGGQQQPPPGRP